MDLEKYLNRINYSGALKPELETLQALQKAHFLNVPFENLDIHTSTRISLHIPSIYEKIVVNHRGGFCYELNGLFYELLRSLGFTTKRISGRVHDNEKGYGREFDHLALIVTIADTEYLTDVGFGSAFISAPLKMEVGLLQNDLSGIYLIDQYDGHYLRVNKIVDGQAKPEYIFKNIERSFEDYADMCLYHQTSSDSHFTKKRFISLPTGKGRISLSGNRLKISEENAAQEILLENEQAFHRALWQYFNVKLA